MFNKLFRKYNQNRKTIWAVIIFVASFVIILHIVFNMIRANQDRQLQINLGLLENNQDNVTISNEISNEGNTNNNVIIGTSNSSSNMTMNDAIQKFVELCNQNKINEAYAMLTEDCKQTLYPTVNDFQNNYIRQVFTEEKSIKIENSMYGDNILKVTFYNGNVLSTGGHNTEEILQDYMFVIKENDDVKLSINKFIQTEEINRNSEIDGIYINISKKDVYLDYEVYEIQITNQINQPILIPSEKDEESIYIMDEKNVKYSSNIDEIAQERMVINSQKTAIYDLRFNKSYNTERIITYINFTDIVKKNDQQDDEKLSITIQI